MHKKTHVIWDWNGTLFNDAVVCWEICQELVQESACEPPSFETFRKIFSIPVDIFWYQLLGQDTSAEQMKELGERFHARYISRRNECSLHDGALQVLQELAKRGVTHSILSSHPQPLLDAIVDICEIRPFFNTIQGHPGAGGSSKIPLGKEHLLKLPNKPEEIVLIGDTVHDNELARALGVSSLLFAHGTQCPTRLEETKAPILYHLREMLALDYFPENP